MNGRVKKALGAAVVAMVMAGCGSSNDFVVTASPQGNTPPTDRQLADLAAVEDPETALRLVPRDHLDDLVVGGVNRQGTDVPQSLSVAQLEADYETLFGSLSQPLGVTESTPEVVANIDFIKSQPDAGYFDLDAQPIENNAAGVTGVAFQTLNYSTTVPLPQGEQTFSVSGGVLIPQGIDKSELRGVVVYFHGTTFNKAQVGSDFQHGETQLCAQVFASQGYVVITPDYVGQGVDWQNVHPYVLYPEVSAQTAVDMVDAAIPLLTETFDLQPGDPALKLFSTGYSEGGSYALWFNTYLRANPQLQDPFYQLTHSVGLEGAYSTSDVTYDYLFDNVSTEGGNPYNIQSSTVVNLAKPALSADAFLSYATYSLGATTTADYDEVFNSQFFAMRASSLILQPAVAVNGQHVNIAQAFALPNTTVSTQLVLAGVGQSGNGSTYPGVLELPISTANSVAALVNGQMLPGGDGAAALQAALEGADLDLSGVPDDSVSMVSLDKDSVVVPNNLDTMVARYPGKIKHAVKIDHTQLNSLSPFSDVIERPIWVYPDHGQGPIFAFLYALKIFNEYQD